MYEKGKQPGCSELPPNYSDLNTGYGMPQNPQYGMNQNPQYGMNQNPQYGMNQNPQYGMPQNQQHGMPQIATIAQQQPGPVGYNPAVGVIVTQPVIATRPTVTPGSDNMAASMLACMFCCWPIGLVAINYSSMARNSFAAGNYVEGRKYGRIAGWLALTAFLIGLTSLVITLGLIFGKLRPFSHHDYDYDY